jgi:hypothetical protein
VIALVAWLALQGPPAPPPMTLRLELPVADVPFNVAHGGRFPSMAQSLWITADAYELLHGGLRFALDPYGATGWNHLFAVLLLGAADLLTEALPPMLAWQHEEWHRAVMANRGIDSYDDVYKLRPFAEIINVSHVTDEDLIRLKREHPADQVRMQTAGIEGNYQLVRTLEELSFFDDSRAPHLILLPLLLVENSAYMFTCASRQADTITADANREEGADVPRRDFTGLDCNGWVYDLHRPDEPYQARGTHPSGVGIDRYRTWSGLSPAEQRYLRTQAWLSLLNGLDPQAFGWRAFLHRRADGRLLAWNAALRHLPTSFGYQIRGDVYLRSDTYRLAAGLQANVNGARVLPGVEASVLRHRLGEGAPLALSLRLAAWLQPDDQRFDSTTAAPGGLATVRLLWEGARVQPFVELEGKSAGWVAGNVYLDANLSARAGLAAIAF